MRSLGVTGSLKRRFLSLYISQYDVARKLSTCPINGFPWVLCPFNNIKDERREEDEVHESGCLSC